MAWIFLILAGLFEAFGVTMMNQLHVNRHWKTVVFLILGFCASLVLLHLSLKTLPMGTVYAIWTGLGVALGTIIGMIFYGESRSWKRLVFIAMIVCSAIGLKMTT
ncbi:DMT family transporter [Bacillus massilinigeriensis]|uniref:DMT family transporter n=1 Tax=Bacillus massilionigeriensis TaxID=1805475 RepID=UPI00096B4A4A|nr:multidrug efflux SMR transporter [Bacillus massilionigeriensis]